MYSCLHKLWVTVLVSLLTFKCSCTDAIMIQRTPPLPQTSKLEQSWTEIQQFNTPTSSRQKRLLATNSQASSPNALTKYDFEYQIHGGGNFFGHSEKRNGVETHGEYFVILPDFRRQVVKYYVDSTGYHATVSYEPITSVGNEKTINLLPPSTPDRNTHSSSSSRRKSYKKIVRKRVPKRRRSSQEPHSL